MRLRRRKNLEERIGRASGLLIRDGAFMTHQCAVELGCGFGRFACETAAARPGSFIIGIEREENAAIIGMERAARESLNNIRFILDDARAMSRYFAPGVIEELYIHFCDPWPHRKHAPRRLVSRVFLRQYAPLLAPGGFLRFRTDNAPLFEFAQKELDAEGWTVKECYAESPPEPIMTDYEIKFRSLGVPICSLVSNK
jgi:tRNA (guanine-N7-)-methyltransferase